MPVDALTLAARRLQGRGSDRNRYPMPGDLAAAIDPRTISTPALRLLDQNLLDVAEGRCKRLVWSMPPQEGKA